MDRLSFLTVLPSSIGCSHISTILTPDHRVFAGSYLHFPHFPTTSHRDLVHPSSIPITKPSSPLTASPTSLFFRVHPSRHFKVVHATTPSILHSMSPTLLSHSYALCYTKLRLAFTLSIPKPTIAHVMFLLSPLTTGPSSP
mmetsp:Transcript_9016/g.12495  ORF Transcript_9016/g.12495 Transcript_9016/m.12495 type:complete len:141 (-) Transcript_9016:24-446(-)